MMKVKIINGGTHSFMLLHKGQLGINVANHEDIIEVFRWVNNQFKSMAFTEEEETYKIVIK